MQPGGKIRHINRPGAKRTQKRTPAAQRPRCGRAREKGDIDKVRKQNRPEKWYCTREKEASQKYSDGESMAQDHKRLEASFKPNIQGCPVDTEVDRQLA